MTEWQNWVLVIVINIAAIAWGAWMGGRAAASDRRLVHSLLLMLSGAVALCGLSYVAASA
jgi:hypothetical protein